MGILDAQGFTQKKQHITVLLYCSPPNLDQTIISGIWSLCRQYLSNNINCNYLDVGS